MPVCIQLFVCSKSANPHIYKLLPAIMQTYQCVVLRGSSVLMAYQNLQQHLTDPKSVELIFKSGLLFKVILFVQDSELHQKDWLESLHVTVSR